MQKQVAEEQAKVLEARLQVLDQENRHFRELLHASSSCFAAPLGGTDMEITNLNDQLEAVLMLKNALNNENLHLHQELQVYKMRLEKVSRAPATTCVICLDNLANVVCIPCKHLSLCLACSAQPTLAACPLCRERITEKMQIFMP